MPQRSFLNFVAALLPLWLWSLCFAVLYAIATLACRLEAMGGGLGLVLSFAVLLLTLVPLAWIVARGIGTGFLHRLSRLLGGLALAATLWLLAPLLLLRLC